MIFIIEAVILALEGRDVTTLNEHELKLFDVMVANNILELGVDGRIKRV